MAGGSTPSVDPFAPSADAMGPFLTPGPGSPYGGESE